jgi:probable addiction module antidote protein
MVLRLTTSRGANYGSQIQSRPALCGGEEPAKAMARTNASHPTGGARHTMSTTPEAFAPFDTADYLDDIDAAVAHLEAVFEETGDDLAFVAQALGTIARSGNVSELARRTGMSREGLYKALSADGNPSSATIVKVTRALGLRMRFTSGQEREWAEL